MTKTEVAELHRRLEDLRVEVNALEMDLLNIRQFLREYILNERAALMSVAKFAESKGVITIKKDPD